MTRVDLPPERLMRRVGWDIHAAHPSDVFEQRGALQWEFIKSRLPSGSEVEGMRILDFGCGVGRILRAAVRADPGAEFVGCDIDQPSIDWLERDLAGRARVFTSGELPPLPLDGGGFDLVYAFSVFTHLVDSWSAWLLELHRVLATDGIAVLTIFGPGHEAFGEEVVSAERIGMNVLYPSASWDTGGPLILHSEWWLRAHWGRAFEIVALIPGEPAGPAPLYGQGVVVARKLPVELSIADLERPEPDEPREIAALQQNVASLRREVARHAAIYQTRSWTLTAPHRSARRRILCGTSAPGATPLDRLDCRIDR